MDIVKSLGDAVSLLAEEAKANGMAKGLLRVMEQAFAQTGKRDFADEKNVVVIRLDDIGDNVLMSAFLRELRAGFKDKRITLVVNKVVYNLVELCPYVDEVLAFPGDMLTQSVSEWLITARDFCAKHFWKKNIALCLLPRWDLDIQSGDILGYLSGAKERIAYSERVWKAKTEKRQNFDSMMTRVLIEPPTAVHDAERNFFFLEQLGITVNRRHMEIWTSTADKLKARELLRGASKFPGKILIAVTTGGSRPSKIYPKEMFADALKIIATDNNAVFVFLGAKKDEADARLNFIRQ